MPYIPEWRREVLTEFLPFPENAGELNYTITDLILGYLGDNPNYQKFNDVVGALECAKLELVRRSVSPYEDKKALENGDLPYPYRRNVE